MPLTPYVVGQWVRGDSFYGRGELLEQILHGNRNCLWLLGTRRIGKTSVLKQLEFLALGSEELRCFPLFWDLQGSDEPHDLDESFGESLLDADDRLDTLRITPQQLKGEDLFETLGRLRRELRTRNLRLLLLCDEVEELININRKDPRFLRRLRRAMQSAENIRTVLASNIKLWELAHEETSTSPFLHGFSPPLFVSGLTDDEARLLVRQSRLPDDSRPKLEERSVERIRQLCNNHPYLLQLVGEGFRATGDLDRVIDEIANDEMVTNFFSVDFDMLTTTERDIIRIVAEEDEASSDTIHERVALGSSSVSGSLQRLEQLGFLSRASSSGYVLANYFLRTWCKAFAASSPSRRDDRQESPSAAVPGERPGTHPESLRRVDDRYDLLTLLGRGASGEVYEARDTLLQSVIAIKLLKPTRYQDADSLERLRREVVLSRELTHPNIVRTYHLGEAQGLKYVTMEYVHGADLSDVLSKEGPFSVERTLSISRKLSGALAFAHDRGVLHRDIKPSNILIDRVGEPRIGDFGLARLLEDPGITRDGVFVGTPAYASPEQIRGESLDHRSDVYGLGLVIFEMATGRRPFVGGSVSKILSKHRHEPPPSPADLEPGLPRELSDLILRCLAKEPSGRFQTAAGVQEALEAVRG
jgi:tRNA A-37 threonylcarbamoyl transferase component Bud32